MIKRYRPLIILLFVALFPFWSQAQEIRLKTQKKIGSKISLTLYAEGNLSLSGVKETPTSSDSPQEYTLEQQEIVISGDLRRIKVGNSELTEISLQGCNMLEELDCSQNLLTTLNLAETPSLKKLSCYANNLTHLDLSVCPLLEQLKCTNNQISVLKVGHLTKLKELTCSLNKISQLDLSKMKQLETLKCYRNQLASLDLSACTALEKLWCSENSLETLDLSHNDKLRVLWCYNNKLSTITTKELPNLLWLHCENNQLHSLDCSHMPKLDKLAVHSNAINGKEMSALINSLPQKSGVNTSFLVIDTHNSQEKNICTANQVALASAKGWNVLDYCGGVNDHQGKKYNGSTTATSDLCSDREVNVLWTLEGILLYPIEKGAVVKVYNLSGGIVAEAIASHDAPLLLQLVTPSEGTLVVTLDGKLLRKITKGNRL